MTKHDLIIMSFSFLAGVLLSSLFWTLKIVSLMDRLDRMKDLSRGSKER